jgi:hypothetical protein
VKLPTTVDWQLQRLGIPAAPLTPLGGGLSECRLWRVGTPPQAWVIKAWPRRETTAERLLAIHRWLEAMQQNGIAFLPSAEQWPDGQTVLVTDAALWERLNWRVGQSRPPSLGLGESDVDQLCEMLARLHHTSSQWHSQNGPAAGLAERAVQLERLIDGPPITVPSQLWPPLEIPTAQAAQRTGSQLQRLATGGLAQLRVASRTAVQLCWIPRDIWYPHLLWDHRRPVGLIDMGAARIDWPGLDLVRLFGSYFALDASDRWRSVVECYLAHRRRLDPPTPLCPSLNLVWLQGVDQASLVLSIAFWLRRLGTPRSGSLPEPSVDRLRELLARLPESGWGPEQA